MATSLLAPATGRRTIEETDLAPAQILVTTTGRAIARVIRGFTRSPVSHVMLYAGGGRVVEAVGRGVVVRPLHEALHGSLFTVAYERGGMNAACRDRVVRTALAWVGCKYDVVGAIRGVPLLPRWLRWAPRIADEPPAPARFYCSRLVLEAYRRAGVPLVADASGKSTPRTILETYRTGVLEYVGHLAS